MRYLIVTYDDYFNIPYIRSYEEALRRSGNAYDIVLWNRSGQETVISNSYVFSAQDSRSKIGKIIPFLRWRRFVLQLLKKKEYDRLIVLTTMPAVLLADRLLGEYREKYWLDIRDFTYENVPFYKKLVEKLVHGASSVSISSPAFQSFLPECGHIYLTHNISNQEFARASCDLDVHAKPITIGFVGGIQFVEQNQKLLRQLANNPDYRLKYVGKAHLGCDLQPFCTENAIENVEFYPAFTNDQKPQIYENIQLINCVYGSKTPVSRLLLPNRLYDCVLFKKPIIVSKGTYLADVVAEYDLGVAIDVDGDEIPTVLDGYLENFDCEKFEDGCHWFLEKVSRELLSYENALDNFCSGS